MRDLKVNIKIKAGVEGQQEVSQLSGGLEALSTAAGQPVSDPTGPLRQGAAESSDAISHLRSAMSRAAAAIAAAGVSIAGVFATMRASLRDASADDVRLRKLEGVVRATGASAGFTAKEVRAMAQEMALATLGSTQGFEDAAAALMTFKKVSGETFEQALALSQDLASVIGGDTKSAAMQLGKALEDPATGLSALTRSGVSFTEAQKRVIASLVETGRVAEAQKIILDQVAAQVGGVAQDMAGGFAGAVDTLGQRLEELRIRIGRALSPLAQKSVELLTQAVEFLTEHFDLLVSVVKVLGAGLGALVAVKLLGWLAAAGKAAASMGAVLRALRMGAMAATVAKVGLGRALLALAGPIGVAVSAGMALYELWQRYGPAADQAGAAMRAAATAAADALDKVSAQAGAALQQIEQVLETTHAALGQAAQGGVTAARELSDALSSSVAQKASAVDESLRLQLQAIERSGQSERAQIANGVRAHAMAAREKTAAAEGAGRQMMAAWQRAYDAAREAAQALGQDTTELERQSATDRKRIMDTLAQHYRGVVGQMMTETQRHLDAARQADEELARFRVSTEDRVRALRQRGMSDEAAYVDRLKQIEEKQSAARQALQRGDFERAKQLAEQAINLAESNAREVTRRVKRGADEVTETVLSQAQASAVAIQQIESASRIVESAIARQGQAHRQAAQHAQSAYDEVKQKLAEVQSQIDAIAVGNLESLTLKVEADVSEVRARIDELRRLSAQQEILLQVKLDLDAARLALEKDPLSVDAQVRLDQAEQALARLRDEQARNPVGLLAEVDLSQAADAIDALRRETQSRHTVQVDAQKAKTEIESLQKPTSSVHTVHVRRVEQHAMGGWVGAVQRFARGGAVFPRVSPGRVLQGPGTETSDSIPAMLSRGEYVVRAASVRKYGRALLDAINFGVMSAPMHLASGGMVPALTGAASSGAASSDVVLRIEDSHGQAARVRTSRDEAAALVKVLKRAGVRLS